MNAIVFSAGSKFSQGSFEIRKMSLSSFSVPQILFTSSYHIKFTPVDEESYGEHKCSNLMYIFPILKNPARISHLPARSRTTIQ